MNKQLSLLVYLLPFKFWYKQFYIEDLCLKWYIQDDFQALVKQIYKDQFIFQIDSRKKKELKKAMDDILMIVVTSYQQIVQRVQ